MPRAIPVSVDGTPGAGKGNIREAQRIGAQPGVNPVQPISSGGATPRSPRGHAQLTGTEMAQSSPPHLEHLEQDGSGDLVYRRFHAAVALAQLTRWLPARPGLLIDISGAGTCAAEGA